MAFQTLYDVSRDWGQMIVPILLTAGWLIGFAVFIRILRSDKQRKPILLFVWLAAWTAVGCLGFGNVWFQHFRCIHELKSGHYLIAEGPITFFRPEVGKSSEQLTVAGQTFEYYSANLSRGGMRYTGAASSKLHLGAYVRVAYDRNRSVLRLELRQRDQ